ncbi:MAG: GGDEF domain-containing protein [Betaproteobacteria bacterium]|nr:GGDEF domain-containing protein [Betaproteobacteria bacterium]
MILDVRTIVAMLVVSSVLMAITIAVGTRMGHGSGIVKWAAGLALLAVGWTLLAARGAAGFVGVALADAILVAGLCFGLAGLVEFGGRTAPRLILYGPGPITLALVTALLGRHDAVTLLTGCELAVIFGAMGVAAIRLGPGVGPARWMLVVACFTGAIAILLRAVVIWLNPATYTDVFAGSNQHASVFVVLFACTIVIPVAFLLMQRERAAVELYRLATIDPLTGLFNRRAFLDLAARELARARRLKSWYAVLMLDLDFFKRVNDDYGHQAGDRVLAAFGALGSRWVNCRAPSRSASASLLQGAAGLSLDAVIARADEAMTGPSMPGAIKSSALTSLQGTDQWSRGSER